VAKIGTGQRNRFIVGLDGLRTLAVIAVIAYHFAPKIIPGGFIGVDIFFVISGFLITTLLIDERRRFGHIALRGFWLRRARRLLPALFLTICIVSSVVLFIRGDILVGLGRQILGAATFSNNWVEIAAGSNYFDASNPHLFMNFWSLAVEEQFYLIWPFIILLFTNFSLIAKRPKTAMWFCATLALSSAILMAILFRHTDATRVYYGTDTHLFGLMIGGFLAFWKRADEMGAHFVFNKLLRHKRAVQKIGLGALLGLGLLIAFMRDNSSFTYMGGLALASMLAAIVLFVTVTTRGWLHKLFALRPLTWIGKRSYGIYLWHWPLLIVTRHLVPSGTSPWIIASITATCTVLIAAVSFRFLEMPIRHMGIKAFVARGFKRRIASLEIGRLHPRPVLLAACIPLILTLAAVIAAPTKTTAQLRIEAGRQALKQAEKQIAQTQLATHIPQTTNLVLPTIAQPAATNSSASPAVLPADVPPMAGSDITVIGDSVTLASGAALVQHFPGILVNAEISRSMREGGLDTISAMLANGQIRKTVVIALGTNGYYGAGNLDTVMNELSGHNVIFVTAHAPNDWSAGNNDNLHQTAKRYPNMYIAEWDAAISQHTDLLVDGIHPNAAGADMYANCVAAAIAQVK
jgi:peptidoglycan/LPS O-acetylase OafA/YrhL